MQDTFPSTDEEAPPPPYETLTTELEGVAIRSDGRINIDCRARLGRQLSYLVGSNTSEQRLPPLIVGSRGDVQPFVALGRELQEVHGHRVRIATHATFENFVRSAGLEFYAIGGDPADLMAYIVKNPGLTPRMASLKAGEVGRKRATIAEMLDGCWKSCIRPDQKTQRPFVADAIIANPPSFAHVHCAQALGIPLHIMFTMPWTGTRAFAHPLANLENSFDTNQEFINLMSYGIVEWMTWQGLGDLVNKWRTDILDLERLQSTQGPNLLEVLKVPHTYCWSPALVPRPSDWPQHIDVCGFFFRDPPQYEPHEDLAAFLSCGPRPIYIGFGSIVIDNADTLTEMILEAVRMTGARAIISRGWSKLGQGRKTGGDIFYLDDCPHEWLFKHVAAVIHHGGAGTTACGLLNGVPTFVVPFFGDQHFWGTMVASRGAGPQPIPYRHLDTYSLVRSIRRCLDNDVKVAAEAVSSQMQSESGVSSAINSFHAQLPSDINCAVNEDAVAVWVYRDRNLKIKLSQKVAAVLIQRSVIDAEKLYSFQSRPITIEITRWEPVSAIVSAFLATTTSVTRGAANIVVLPYGTYRQLRSRLPVPEDANSIDKVDSKDYDSAIARHVAVSVLKSSGKFLVSPVKGLFLDIPLAATDGMWAITQRYDAHGYKRMAITDWKSGSVVAMHSFANGFREGFTDIFTRTAAGKKEEGSKGVAKGLASGLVSLTAKTGAGSLGLFAYSCQGIQRSLHAAFHSKVKKEVEQAKRAECQWFADMQPVSSTEMSEILNPNF